MSNLKSTSAGFYALSIFVLAWMVAPAAADDVLAGSDLFLTPAGPGGGPGLTYQDLSGDPIPADFFGPGSDPFDGVIYLRGNPFSVPGPMGTEMADTIVERLSDASLPDHTCSHDTIDTQIIALELVRRLAS